MTLGDDDYQERCIRCKERVYPEDDCGEFGVVIDGNEVWFCDGCKGDTLHDWAEAELKKEKKE